MCGKVKHAGIPDHSESFLSKNSQSLLCDGVAAGRLGEELLVEEAGGLDRPSALPRPAEPSWEPRGGGSDRESGASQVGRERGRGER